MRLILISNVLNEFKSLCFSPKLTQATLSEGRKGCISASPGGCGGLHGVVMLVLARTGIRWDRLARFDDVTKLP